MGIFWVLGQSVAMFVVMGFDSSAVNSASNYCNSAAGDSCHFTPFISTCVLDAFAGLTSAFAAYVLFNWSFYWCPEENSNFKSEILIHEDETAA